MQMWPMLHWKGYIKPNAIDVSAIDPDSTAEREPLLSRLVIIFLLAIYNVAHSYPALAAVFLLRSADLVPLPIEMSVLVDFFG